MVVGADVVGGAVEVVVGGGAVLVEVGAGVAVGSVAGGAVVVEPLSPQAAATRARARTAPASLRMDGGVGMRRAMVREPVRSAVHSRR